MICQQLTLILCFTISYLYRTHSQFLGDDDKTPQNYSTLHLESFWDVRSERAESTAVQAGDSVTFICRVWQVVQTGVTELDGSLTEGDHSKQSVYLYCPLSVAYCSQDCLLVDVNWPVRCTKQVRTLYEAQHAPGMLRHPNVQQWHLQELIYTLDIATVVASGTWSCSYGGSQSTSSQLRVRDRPTLLSFTSEPKSPVIAGSPVNLTCRAAPSPNSPWYNFIWRRLGTGIPPAHSTLRLSDTVSVLMLTSTQVSDDGRYRCHVVRNSDQSGHQLWNDVPTASGYIRTVGKDRKNLYSLDKNETQLDTHNPAVLYLDLDVYHAPSSIAFTVEPPEPQPSGSVITLICHVSGGKPAPKITFYRLPEAGASNDESSKGIFYFNSTNKQAAPVIKENTIQLQLIVEETDHEARLGCSATSVVISGRMLSQPKKLLVLFPPGPPILTAIPHGAVSENRTRVFVCRASRGSYPVAQVRWKLQPAMDYASTLISKRPYVLPVHQISNATSVYTDMVDFDIDKELKLSGRPQMKDPNNRGIVAMSEARLTSRPWFNGARVSCQLDWSYNKRVVNSSDTDSIDIHSDTVTEVTSEKNIHDNTASLTTEVLFAPSAISLSVNPLSGIQEKSGEQVLECTTTSSFPAAKITWLRRDKSTTKGQHMTVQEADLSGYVTLETSLETLDSDRVIEENVVVETLPGVYGGKRVVSRLRLVNLTRLDDGTVYICKVTHIEWVRAYGRLHSIVVLYPPTLSMKIWPETPKERMTSKKTIIQCIPTGGRPLLDFVMSETNAAYNQSKLGRGSGDAMWKFTWLFRPTYPDNLWFHGQSRPLSSYPGLFDSEENQSKIESHGNRSEVILKEPGRKYAGEYTCLLEGPGGTVRDSIETKFEFPPELVPSGQTAFTSPVGNSAVLELFVWAYPYPLPLSRMHEGYSTPMRVNNCDQSPKSIASSTTNRIAYSWYKVSSDGKSSTRLISSKQRDNQGFVDRSGSFIWTDVILVNLASIFTQQFHAFSPNERTHNRNADKQTATHVPIPTVVYRLIFDQVQQSDYGEYVCEIEHWAGKRPFLARLQPPVDSTVPMKDVQFTRAGSVVHLRFDPTIMKLGDVLINTRLNDSITSLPPGESSTKRDTESNKPRKETAFMWMLIRICAMVDPYRNPINGTKSQSSSCTSKISTELNQIKPNLCINRVIDNPNRGVATILLDALNHPATYEPNLSEDERTDHLPKGLGNHSISFVSDQYTLPIRWDKVPRVAYQLRFYDGQGRLAHHTNWMYETTGRPINAESTLPVNMGVMLPATLVLTFLIVLLLSAIPIIFLVRNRKRKHEMDSNIDSGCLSLKNPLSDTPLELLQTTAKPENFYVANATVVDSPCPLLGRTNLINRPIVLKSGPGLVHGSSESVCSPHGSFQLLPNTTYKTNPLCVLEKTADGRLVLSDRSMSPMYTPVLRRGSAGGSPEMNQLFNHQRTCTMQNRYKDAHGEQVFVGPESKLLSTSSSHYGTGTHMREHSPFHNSPLFIYNKCYPNESNTPSHCVSPARPCFSEMNALSNGQPSSPPLKQSSIRELVTFGVEQPMYYSRFQGQTVPVNVIQSSASVSPYLHRPTLINELKLTARPVCASQVMPRRELPVSVDPGNFPYETGSLKTPYLLQSGDNLTRPTTENNQMCQLRTFNDSSCIQSNNAATTDSASLTSSELGASPEPPQANVPSRRCKTGTNNSSGCRPVGMINDELLDKHLTDIASRIPNFKVDASETDSEEVIRRTPYDNELLQDDNNVTESTNKV